MLYYNQGDVMIVIAGSAANPPHRGHTELIRLLLQDERVTSVWWSVDYDRPDKPVGVSYTHRCTMAQLLFSSEFSPRQLARIELGHSDHTAFLPTAHHLKSAQEKYPDVPFAWAVGADHLEQVDGRTFVERHWVDGDELIRTYPYFIIPRHGYHIPDRTLLPGTQYMLSGSPPHISSTELRARFVERNLSGISEFVPQVVIDYILQHDLYGVLT